MVRVLGPVDALAGRRVITIASRLERKLLAALTLSARHTVSAELLAHILWGDEQPPSRNNSLQTYVSRLRHDIGHDRIVSEDSGYLLLVGDDEVDALIFEQIAGRAAELRGKPERCRAACREALSLWRGAAFGTFADEDPFRLEALRLDEARMFVVELRLGSEIELGNQELVVGSLRALAEEYPYRERIWELLVSALSRSGRRIEALRACTDLRRVLADAGLEPSPLVLRLEHEAREASA